MRLRVTSIALILLMAACGSVEPAETTSGQEATTVPADKSPTTSARITPAKPEPDSTTSSSIAEEDGTVVHPAGLSFQYPAGWAPAGLVISTAFTNGAECLSAMIVDWAPPPDSGQAPGVQRSVVQVCARPIDELSLQEFVSALYSETSVHPVQTEVAGLEGLQVETGDERVVYVQTDSHRFQIYLSVNAEPDTRSIRIGQAEEILQSFQTT